MLLQTKSQDHLGNKDYTEQPWAAAGPSSGKHSSPGKGQLQPADHQGLQRKTICSGSGMGLKVRYLTVSALASWSRIKHTNTVLLKANAAVEYA